MIIWIASYPRSGNTLTTQIISQVFGQSCFEKYNNLMLENQDVHLRRAAFQQYKGTWEEFRKRSQDCQDPVFIKTHDAPEDDSPCIYVVRNGWQVLESYHAYHRKVLHTECSWEELIIGAGFPFLSWGSHLDAWNPLQRPRTLLLHYEQIAGSDESFLLPLADFLQMKMVTTWKNPFLEYQREDPNFFRSGLTDQTPQVPESARKLFIQVHGDWMTTLGYTGEGQDDSSNAQKMLRNLLSEREKKLQFVKGREAKLWARMQENQQPRSPSGVLDLLFSPFKKKRTPFKKSPR